MPNFITVSREFGSGGREIGKRLADELGYAYYDREIVAALSEQTGMDEGYLDRTLDSSVWSSYPVHFAQSFSEISGFTSIAMQLLTAQTKVIRELAEKGDAVFVGRGADALLEDAGAFKLFIYADRDSKLERCRLRASAEEKMSDKEMLREMKRIDKARAEFHDIISSYRWGDRYAYHLCVNTSGLDISSMIPALAAYYRIWLAGAGKP